MKSDELEIARILQLKSEIRKLKLDDPIRHSFFTQIRYETRALAKLDIADWIEGFYNRKRIHTPIETGTGSHSPL